MANGICDIDKQQPAVHTVHIRQDERHVTLEVCNTHYRQLSYQQSQLSPTESLQTGKDFGQTLTDGLPELTSQLGYPIPRDLGVTNIEEMVSAPAKELIQRAAEQAVAFGQRELATEHLLYVLMGSNIVQAALEPFGVQSDAVRQHIDTHAPKTKRAANLNEPIEVTVSPDIKQVFEAALQASRKLGHRYIGPEHLLVGIAQTDGGMGGPTLRSFDVKPAALMQEVRSLAARPAGSYWRDLTSMAKSGLLDPVIGRTAEIEATIQILAKRARHNPLLLGEPGVGKAAIVEGLAQLIADGKAPKKLQGKRILELDITALVASPSRYDAPETRLSAALDEIAIDKDACIVFIRDLHTILGNGIDMGDDLKLALTRHDVRFIGATTLGEYRLRIEKEPILREHFRPVLVAEPTVEQTIEIVQGLRDKYESHHNVHITDQAIAAAAALSDRYIASCYLPDKAIDLIDQAASLVSITNPRRGKVTPKSIATVIANSTGVAAAQLAREEHQRLVSLEEQLHQRVIGHNQAIHAVSDVVRIARAGLSRTDRPIAAFLFAGPQGVGKTQLAKALASAVYGDQRACVTIDLAEYMDRFSVPRLIGTPGQTGVLTEAVHNNPHSVLLLSSADQAHADVHSLLQQIVDNGRILDGTGRAIDFSNTIIIMTVTTTPTGAEQGSNRLRQMYLDTLREHISTKLLDHLDELVLFEALTKEQFVRIAAMQLESIRATARGQGIELHFDRSVSEHLARIGYRPPYGVGELKRHIRTEIESPLAKQILAGRFTQGCGIAITYKSGKGIVLNRENVKHITTK